jgi:hypothetical protein
LSAVALSANADVHQWRNRPRQHASYNYFILKILHDRAYRESLGTSVSSLP